MEIDSFQVLQRGPDGLAHVLGHAEPLKACVPYAFGEAVEVFVGDVFILAGQSNMEGVGNLVDVEEPSPFVRNFQSCELWDLAEEPLHWLNESPRSVHRAIWGMPPLDGDPEPRDPNRNKGAGLGLPFGKRWHERTGVPVGLVPCAHGGTSMSQWSPSLKDEGGASLYGATVLRHEKVGGKVAAILWYQGESDANPTDAPLYFDRMKELIAAFRRDFNQPDLPFYYVQLGRFATESTVDGDATWSVIRESQRLLQSTVPHTAMVSAIDLDLDDAIHISTPGLKRLGKRLVDVALGIAPPDLAGVKMEADGQRIRVSFKNLRGGLRVASRPAGLSLRSPEGKDVARIYKITLDGDDAILHCDPLATKGLHLWYGYGFDPYCNLTDAEDAAIPAFGPVVLE